MASSTVEDYLKRIYLEGGSLGGDLVPMGRLARAMGVAPGTVTAMVKSLVEGGAVEYAPYCGVRLTAQGQGMALKVLRRHRILELFLVEVLGMDWAEVHEEAERLEHALSDRLLERMDRHLGHPGYDPHGDPIPAADGALAKRQLERLSTLPEGAPCRVARIVDQSPAFLRAIEELGLGPGVGAQIHRRDEGAATLAMRVGALPEITVALAVAEKILVERAR